MDIFFMSVCHLSCSLSIESNVKLHIDAQCNCSDVCVSVAHAHLLNVYFTPNCGVILFTLPWTFVFVPEPNMTSTISFKTILESMVDRSWPLVTTEKLAIAVSVSNQIVIEKLRTGFEHPSLNTQSPSFTATTCLLTESLLYVDVESLLPLRCQRVPVYDASGMKKWSYLKMLRASLFDVEGWERVCPDVSEGRERKRLAVRAHLDEPTPCYTFHTSTVCILVRVSILTLKFGHQQIILMMVFP